jgi:predicted nuclease of predicted toxin-antitoxin system
MALQFYSNENFPIVMVNLLRAEGYDVLTSYEAGQANQRIPDDQVLRYATTTNRILLTENRQDFIDLHRITLDHPGIIIFKFDRDYTGKIKAITDFLNTDGQPLANRLLRIKKQNMKAIGPTFVVQEYFRT